MAETSSQNTECTLAGQPVSVADLVVPGSAAAHSSPTRCATIRSAAGASAAKAR